MITNQKRMAAEIFSRKEGKKVGIHRVWVDPNYLTEVADAVQKDDVRMLIEDGIIKSKPIKGTSRSRARKAAFQKSKGRNQRLRFKRRRNAETDYHRRFKMLRGGNPRAVVRVSNKQVTCQLVAYEKDGDRVISTITGKTLVESYKWPKEASRKSVPACYLAGYALAKSAISRGFESAILDIGLAASSKGNRAYAALKGMVDAGLNIPHSQNILPSEERISGEHIGDEIQNAVAVSKESMESDK